MSQVVETTDGDRRQRIRGPRSSDNSGQLFDEVLKMLDLHSVRVSEHD